MTSLTQKVYFPYFQYDFNLTQELVVNERFFDDPVLDKVEKIFKVVSITLVAAFESLKNGIKFLGNGLIALINLGYGYYQKDRTTSSEAAAAILHPAPVPLKEQGVQRNLNVPKLGKTRYRRLPKELSLPSKISLADPEILRLRRNPSV